MHKYAIISQFFLLSQCRWDGNQRVWYPCSWWFQFPFLGDGSQSESVDTWLCRCIDETTTGTVNPSSMSNYSTLKVMRNHIHPDMKIEYMYEEDSRALWTSLKNRYEQHKAIILPKAMHEWNHLHLQDFKTIDKFNHVVHKISDFVRKNLLKRRKLKRLCLWCSHQKG